MPRYQLAAVFEFIGTAVFVYSMAFAGVKFSPSTANRMAVRNKQTTRHSEAGTGIINDISVTVAAQTAAIDALSKAMGTDPDQIAKAVESAVKAKLDQLEITVNVADGQS